MTKKKVKKKATTKKKSISDLKPAKPIRVKFITDKKRNPAFEQVLAEEAALAESKKAEEMEKAGRSDEQPGYSGEAPGAQPAATFPPKAARAIAPVLKIPFAIWSNIEDIPEIRLTQDEALEWAEPLTDILEYYFPGKIPEIAWMWLMLLESTGRVIDTRIEIRHQKKKQISEAPNAAATETAAPGPDASSSSPAPHHNGADPATEYPQG